MSITRACRWFVGVALLLSVAAAASHADTNPSPAPGADRRSTVIVSVPDGGFHWADAGVGAAATLAAALLALGLVLALRPAHAPQASGIAPAQLETTARTKEE